MGKINVRFANFLPVLKAEARLYNVRNFA